MTERISLEGKGRGCDWGRPRAGAGVRRTSRRTQCPVVVNDLGTNVAGFGKDSGIAEEVADLIRARGGEAIRMTVMFPPSRRK